MNLIALELAQERGAALVEKRLMESSTAVVIPDDVASNTIFDMVPLDSMFVAPYGRPFSQRKVDGLLKNWFLPSVGVLYLSFRYDSNNYALLDGQHRKVAAEQKGITKLPARIYIDLSYEQEADLYVRFATVNKQTALDRFRARIEAKEEHATTIRAIVRSHSDMDIATTSAPEPNMINAVDTLERVYNQYGAKALGESCLLIQSAWGNQSRAWGATIIRGMAMFWIRYHEVCKYKELIERLSCISPEQVLAKANAKRAALSSAESQSAVGLVLVDLYNDRRRSGRLPEWKRMVYGEKGKETARASMQTANAALKAKRAKQVSSSLVDQ